MHFMVLIVFSWCRQQNLWKYSMEQQKELTVSVQNRQQGEQEQRTKVSWNQPWLVKPDVTYSGIQLQLSQLLKKLNV